MNLKHTDGSEEIQPRSENEIAAMEAENRIAMRRSGTLGVLASDGGFMDGKEAVRDAFEKYYVAQYRLLERRHRINDDDQDYYAYDALQVNEAWAACKAAVAYAMSKPKQRSE